MNAIIYLLKKYKFQMRFISFYKLDLDDIESKTILPLEE
jgi:hypothetical protein